MEMFLEVGNGRQQMKVDEENRVPRKKFRWSYT